MTSIKNPAGPSSGSQPRKRKAGGTGKKGKVFVEDKSSLLSLMSDITSSKDAIAEQKVRKTKQAIGPSSGAAKAATSRDDADALEGGFSSAATSPGAKPKRLTGDKKRAEKTKALEEAKRKILAKEKERRARRKGKSMSAPADSSAGAADAKPKKKVGFA